MTLYSLIFKCISTKNEGILPYTNNTIIIHKNFNIDTII